MMSFVFISQTIQHRAGLGRGRLPHRHRLKAAFQCRVLLDVTAVFVNGGGTHQLQFAPRQHRLENVGGIHRALCRAGANEVVQLVNKKQDVTGAGHLGQGIFHPFLKVAAILGAGHHPGQIQGEQTLFSQRLRHLTRGDALCQPLRHRGLAHPRLADEAGVILGAAAEDVDHPTDLLLPSHHGIQHPRPCQSGEIPPELV